MNDELLDETICLWRERYRRWVRHERRRAEESWSRLRDFGLSEPPRDITSRDEAVQAGFAWVREGRYQSSDPELLAALNGSSSNADAARGHANAYSVEERPRFLWQARRELGRGADPKSLLAQIVDGPAEALLHHARLLRIEVETLADPPVERAHFLVDDALALLDELPPRPAQARCVEILLALAGRAPEAATHIFSEAMARALAGARNARTLRAEEDAIDDVVSAMLRGHRIGESHEDDARRHEECARHLAFVAGTLAARHGAWWDDAWRALSDEDDALAVAFVRGATDGDVLPRGLIELVRDARPEVSVAAWSAIAAAGPGEANPHALLATIPREPSEAARAEVASSWRLPSSENALLVALLGDPSAEVRAAATLNLLGRDALDEDALRGLRADLTMGSLRLRDAALRALAWAGEATIEDGEALVRAALDEEAAGDGPSACSAAGALAVWAGPEPHWRELYRRATEDPSWLRALGLALAAANEEALPMLFPAPTELVEPLRIQALRHLGDDETAYAAAMVLASHPAPEERLFDVFRRPLAPSDLACLALLAPSARRPHPELAASLWPWIEDEEVEPSTRISALSALGHLAPPDHATLARLGPLVTQAPTELADVAYVALAHVVARATQLGAPSGR